MWWRTFLASSPTTTTAPTTTADDAIIVLSAVRKSPQEAFMSARAAGRVTAVGLVACLFGGPVYAQTVGASLQGVVTDSSGAAVPGVDVVVVNVTLSLIHI